MQMLHAGGTSRSHRAGRERQVSCHRTGQLLAPGLSGGALLDALE